MLPLGSDREKDVRALSLCLVWVESSWEEYQFWVDTDRAALKKVNDMIKELRRTGDPSSGLGKPEPLRGNLSGWWSRHINKKDRLVYKIEGDALIVVQYRGHYSGK